MVGRRGEPWHLLTAGAFVTMVLPLLVFLALQRYFVRGSCPAPSRASVADGPMTARPILRAFTGPKPPAEVLAAIRDGDAAGVALYRSLNVGLAGAVARAGRWRSSEPPWRAGSRRAIVAIDQEGGQLMGVGPPATQFAGNLALAATGSVELARRVAEAMGRELLAMGCNVSWAPDLDLATQPLSPAVGGRSFGDSVVLAGELGAATVEGLQSAGRGRQRQALPGQRRDAGRSASRAAGGGGGPRDAASRARSAPFRAAIDAGVRLVMVSHAAYPALEPDGARSRPALRSRAILGDLLRGELGFEGVVVTDALDMAAVDQADVASAAVAAIESGVDLLLAGPAQADRPGELARLLAALRDTPAARCRRGPGRGLAALAGAGDHALHERGRLCRARCSSRVSLRVAP